jgi:hypothetical protein
VEVGSHERNRRGFGRPLRFIGRVPEVCPAELSDSRQGCGGSFPSRESAEAPSKPKPVAHRQWRDRWRLDDRKVVRRLSRPNGGNAADEKGPRKCCLRVRPRRSRGLRRWCFYGCTSRETSVVKTDSRHLGDVSKWSREAKRGAASSNGEGGRPGRGRLSFSSQKGARADKGRKSNGCPSVTALNESVDA